MCLRCLVEAFGAVIKGGEGKGDKYFRQTVSVFNAKMKVSCLDIDVARLPV